MGILIIVLYYILKSNVIEQQTKQVLYFQYPFIKLITILTFTGLYLFTEHCTILPQVTF